MTMSQKAVRDLIDWKGSNEQFAEAKDACETICPSVYHVSLPGEELQRELLHAEYTGSLLLHDPEHLLLIFLHTHKIEKMFNSKSLGMKKDKLIRSQEYKCRQPWYSNRMMNNKARGIFWRGNLYMGLTLSSSDHFKALFQVFHMRKHYTYIPSIYFLAFIYRYLKKMYDAFIPYSASPSFK